MKRTTKIFLTGLIALTMVLGSAGMVWAAVTIGSTPGISIGTAATGLTFTGGYTATAIQLGTSSSKLTLAAYDDHAIDINTTSGSTNTSNSVRPVHMISTMTGVGGVGGRAEFEMNTEVALGGWANALKGYTDFGTAGSVTGLASAIVAEMRMPNWAMPTGQYFPLEVELVGQANSGTGAMSGFATYRATGTLTNWDANAYFMQVEGLTAGATAMLSLTSQTLKTRMGTQGGGSDRYMVLSQMADGLGLGNSSTAMDLTSTATNKAVEIYTTSSSTSGGTSVQPFYVKSTMTGTGGVGGRATFEMATEVVLGAWANALKGYTDFGTAGSVTGLGSAIVAEMRMPAKTLTGGWYAPMEIELVLQNLSRTGGTPVSFIYAEAVASGGSDGLDNFNETGYIFNFRGLTDTANGVFDASTEATVASTHALRILIQGTEYFIPLNTAVTF